MFLGNVLSQAGHEPASVRSTARISLDKDDGGFSITRSDISTEVTVDGLDDEEFQKHEDPGTVRASALARGPGASR